MLMNSAPISNADKTSWDRVILLIFGLTLVATAPVGCASVQRLEPSQVSRFEGFIRDGRTTQQEVWDRLGSESSTYENGSVLIYHVYLKEDGRMGMGGEGPCHALVLVFDKDGVLERHGLVKHGCRRALP